MTIDWVHFSPWSALAGGALIGLASGLLMLANGRIAGISGILAGVLKPLGRDGDWRIAFLVGLFAAPGLWAVLSPEGLPVSRFSVAGSGGWLAIALGGLLVGFGTRLANGCTSGHGICGLSRLSPRSLVAVGTFMVFGFATVFVVHHLLGGKL